MTKTTTKKQPSAQVQPAQKASALKVANEAKRARSLIGSAAGRRDRNRGGVRSRGS